MAWETELLKTVAYDLGIGVLIALGLFSVAVVLAGCKVSARESRREEAEADLIRREEDRQLEDVRRRIEIARSRHRQVRS